MMRTLRTFMLAAALTIMGTAAWSYPNINATTGLIAVPTAMVVPTGALRGAADAFFFDDFVANARIVYGLAGPLEVGATLNLINNTGFGGTVKYRVPDTVAGFNWAAGASIVSTDDNGEGWQLFVTGTRLFGETGTGLLGTAGVLYSSMEDADGIQPFVGAQYPLGNMTELGGEFIFGTGEFDSTSSFYVRQRLDSTVAGEIGISNAEGFSATGDHRLFVGLESGF